MKANLATALLLIATAASSDDFKTLDGKEYKNVTVSRVEPDGIVVKTESGISKIYFVELPQEVQERFHYHPANAVAHSAEQAGRLARTPPKSQEVSAESTQDGDKILQVQISQVLPNGVLAYGQLTRKTFSGSASSGHPVSGRYSDHPYSSIKPIYIQGLLALRKASVLTLRRALTGHMSIKISTPRAGLWRNGYSRKSLNASHDLTAPARGRSHTGNMFSAATVG